MHINVYRTGVPDTVVFRQNCVPRARPCAFLYFSILPADQALPVPARAFTAVPLPSESLVHLTTLPPSCTVRRHTAGGAGRTADYTAIHV